MPQAFRCVQIAWPLEPLANRAESYVRAGVTDTRDGRVAHCYVVITHQQSIFDLKEDPFLIEEGVLNSIRFSTDVGNTKFYEDRAHPLELQEVKLSTNTSVPARSGSDSIDNFIKEKVIWLAYRTGDATNAVWIADPWDARYLGTSAAELERAGEVLDARSAKQVRKYSPLLSDRLAVSSAEGMTRVVDKIMEAMGHQTKDIAAEK